jgi:hypothetical protein
MNKILLIAVLLLAALSGRSQNTAHIKGKIIDSLDKKPVEFATVAAIDMRDTLSTLIAYTLSNKEGEFALHNIPGGIPVKLLISYVAYQPYRKLFTLKKGEQFDMGIIGLNSRQLQEVVIKGERMPVVVRKDTIIFDAEAFKTRPNAVVEDLLKKLPGVEVDNDGNITVMARKVSKVLVDGREFFPTDIRIATKNLDADLIDKVQVYDDRENDPNHLLPESQLNKIINLKFKKAIKKSIFGKVYAGEGTNNHYQGGTLLNMFKDTLQVSLLGSTNNLNSTGFDFNDLYSMGGVNRGGDAFSRNTFGAGATGKQTKTVAGININTDYGKKLKINLAYVYGHTKTEYSTLLSRQQILNDTTVTTNNNNNSLNTADTHNITASVNWHPNDTTQITYKPSIYITQSGATGSNIGNSFSNFVNPINNSLSRNNTTANSFQFQHSFNYNHQFDRKGESISIDHNLLFSPGSGLNYNNSDLASFVSTFPSYSLRRRGDNDNKNAEVGLSTTYRKPITKKLIADLTTSAGYTHQLDKVSTYDYDPVTGQYDSFLLDLSSDLTRNKWTEGASPGVTYNISKNASLLAHLNMQWQEVNNSFKRNTADINQNFFYLLPAINLNISRFSINYNRNVQLPNIGDMIPYTVVFSPLYSVTGNPALKPTTSNNFNINFNRYNYQSGTSYNVALGASFEQNSIFRQRTINADLVETSMPINRNGRYSYNLNGFVNKQIKKSKDFKLSSRSNVGLSTSRNFFVVNEQSGYQYNYNIYFTEGLSLNWKDKIEINPEYTLTKSFITYSGGAFSNQNTLVHRANTHFNIFLPQKFNIEGYYNYMYNPLVTPGFQKSSNLLSLSIAHQLLKKDRGEIKLSSYDILNQNINSYRYVNENIITDTQSEVVKRYFMLTLQFKFNKSTTKEEGKKPVLIMR